VPCPIPFKLVISFLAYWPWELWLLLNTGLKKKLLQVALLIGRGGQGVLQAKTLSFCYSVMVKIIVFCNV
jgi:hypothetical protein